MKKLLLILIAYGLVVMSLSGCQGATLDNKAYASVYHQIINKLDVTLDQYVYHDLSGYFVDQNFSEVYSHTVQMEAMGQLLNTLDDIMYELDALGNRTSDKAIQTHQSEIEYAIKDIRDTLAQFLDVDILQSISPNKNTLYRETYRFFTDLNMPVLKLVEEEILLSDYLKSYDTETSDDIARQQLKAKNLMRYLYVYMMTASYVAPMEDYTGLHVNPRFPWVVTERETSMAYELSYDIIFEFREFYGSYIQLIDKIPGVLETEDMSYFYTKIREDVDAYESYYQIRSTYPSDFFISGDYKAYQVKKGDHWEFKDELVEFTEMRTNYFIIRDMMSDEKLIQMMY